MTLRDARQLVRAGQGTPHLDDLLRRLKLMLGLDAAILLCSLFAFYGKWRSNAPTKWFHLSLAAVFAGWLIFQVATLARMRRQALDAAREVAQARGLCTNCIYPVPRDTGVCPECGYPYPADAKAS